jgi:hypothetical protein
VKTVSNSNDKFATSVSPYRLAKEAGKIPQMVYNYIRMGLIRARKNELGHWQITAEEANKWYAKWTS